MKFYIKKFSLLSEALRAELRHNDDSGRTFCSKIDDLYKKGFIDGAIAQKEELGYKVIDEKICWSKK